MSTRLILHTAKAIFLQVTIMPAAAVLADGVNLASAGTSELDSANAPAVVSRVPRQLVQARTDERPKPADEAQRPPGIGSAGRNRPGPWDNDVFVYRVGALDEPQKLETFERAGVPTLARLKDGTIIAAFQNFPEDDNRNFDRVAVRLSKDEGNTWSKARPITVEGLEVGLARPFDPTLVPLPDGRIRLYFTSNRSPDFRRSIPAIYSAVSSNGVDYLFEPGVRFAVEGQIVIDCAAALHEGTFHLIVPDNGTAEEFQRGPEQGRPAAGNGYHAICKDGLKFERVADVKLPGNRRWLGNMQSEAGRLIFFGTGEQGLWSAESTDGVKWELNSRAMRIQGADPGAVKLTTDGWLLALTGPPRAGTASSRRMFGQDRLPGQE